MSWFEESFGERYLRLYGHRDQDEATRALSSLFPEHTLAGRRALDLGCGPGRYMRALYERGAWAVGLDLSPVLLEAARRNLSALQRQPRLVRADMRRLPFRDRSFDLTLCMFTTFGYFEPRDAHFGLAEEMARVTGSVIILDLPDAETLERTLVPSSEREVDDMRVRERRWIADEPRRVCKTIELLPRDGGDVVERYDERVHLFAPEEVEEMFARAGYRVEDRLGDYDGAPFEAGRSPRMILRLRREGRRVLRG